MSTSLFLFRQDLRLSDNPGLIEACKHEKVLLAYIHNPDHSMGSASDVWLHHSLLKLNEQLDGKLNIYHGCQNSIVQALISSHQVNQVYWNRAYEPQRISEDQELKQTLKDQNIEAKSFSANLLWEPWTIAKSDGSPYRVFTPYYRKGCLAASAPREPLNTPHVKGAILDDQAVNLADLGLLPAIDWHSSMLKHWQIGEKAAQQKLKQFCAEGLGHYKQGRNFPAKPYVSKLSPHLHFGEISAGQAWHAALARKSDIPQDDLNHFLSELGWREFSYYLLYHFPNLPIGNFQNKFDRFPWETPEEPLKAWKKGLTGYPIVDAGMRELWQTGYVHNRVRMIVGSFLVKNLLIHWHAGARHFEDCLFDADLASNSASWQWVAGCGADAAPYFRIFNPITQGEKFDPQGEYTRHFVPELKDLPDKYLFKPWEAPQEILQQAGIVLGESYPYPLVDTKQSRERALSAFSQISLSSQKG